MSRQNSHRWQRSLNRIVNRFMAMLLRSLWRFNRLSKAGFVLPTTLLLILMVTLTVGALSFRSFSRVEQTIAFREQQTVDSFAAPAVDRAKSKLEYLFTKDQLIVNKRPPSSADLINAVLFASKNPTLTPANQGGSSAYRNKDPYTLPDETQLDITGDGQLDPAWSFNSQDGTAVIYSILMNHQATDPDDASTVTLQDNDATKKAKNLVTRNAPINTRRPNANCPVSSLAGNGWVDAGGNLQKNLQVNVLSITNNGSPTRTVSAAEYQQVRNAPKGNKYGAWFRYDLEVDPGGAFRWNGAMHSESNLITGNNLKAYLVSAPASCIYGDDASDITISQAEDTNGDNIPDGFQGQLIAGQSKDDRFGTDDVTFHAVNTATPTSPYDADLSIAEGSVVRAGAGNVNPSGTNPRVFDVAVDPVSIFTEDNSVSLTTNWKRRQPWNSNVTARVGNISDAVRPYLDDGYRADNRYGPKPVYNALHSLTEKDNVTLTTPHKIGETIDDNPALTTNNAATQEYGLDGYWERRAIAAGLRVIVGQRLELGNRFGWGANDPLYPPDPTTPQLLEMRSNDGTPADFKKPAETRQQRSLRDNLSAVQGMVVYHYSQDSGEIPYICMASTVHPGTEQTLANSRTFDRYVLPDGTTSFPDGSSTPLEVNFLTGKGTNGWEFGFSSFDTNSNGIADEFTNSRPLGKALRNLARFAGDPRGGAPSFPPVQGVEDDALGNALDDTDEFVHPYPYLSMWGDFSVLRRILFAANGTDQVATANAYNSLSPADKASLHSAACTLGMLAYNLDSEMDIWETLLTQPSGNLQSFGVAVSQLIDGVSSSGNPEVEDLISGAVAKGSWTDTNPNTVIDTYCPAGTDTSGFQAACDSAEYYSQFTSEDWINAVIEDQYDDRNPGTAPSLTAAEQDEIDEIRDSIYRVQFGNQIIRDRALGFKTGNPLTMLSGTGNTVAWNPLTGLTGLEGVGGADVVVKTGCDPDIFESFVGGGGGNSGGNGNGGGNGNVTQKPGKSSLFAMPAFFHGEGLHASLTPQDVQILAQSNNGNGNGNSGGNGNGNGNGNSGGSTTGGSTTGGSTTGGSTTGGNGNSGGGGAANNDRSKVALALMYCTNDLGTTVKYPSLYYLLPLFDHTHLGSDGTSVAGVGIDHTQPTTEEYISEGGGPVYIADSNVATSKVNDAVTYSAVDPGDMALTPAAAIANFRQPTSAVSGNPSLINAADEALTRGNLSKNYIRALGTTYETTFLDKAIMDGREGLNVRILDLDINKLTANKPFASNTVAWIPELDAIFYAAREDSAREDSIVRPRNKDSDFGGTAPWTFCRVLANLTGDSKCFMDVVPASKNQKGTFDPPLNSANSISAKPVDMYADPDRRPYGFRLFNGSKFNRSSSITAAGLTFVTDNSVYIKGNFNLHQKSDGTILEEFVNGGGFTNQELGTTFANYANDATGEASAKSLFYGRTNINQDFAKAGVDLWRPAEIFADAVYILSDAFVDGWVEDAFTKANDADNTAQAVASSSSYLNFNRPYSTTDISADSWQREDGLAAGSTDVTLPIKVDRNGLVRARRNGGAFAIFPNEFSKDTTTTDLATGEVEFTSYYRGDLFTRRVNDQIIATDNTRVNALIIAGVVPMRARQGYGGLHNFPRLLESWRSGSTGRNLIISGGFYQLNFSTAATAPWDQDAWEPGAAPPNDANTELNVFYANPNRVWGYDVAFQYTPASPIASRFSVSGRTRSEFYRQLPLSDPYIQRLCSALKTQNSAVSCQ